MKNKILSTLLVLGIQLSTVFMARDASAGLLGIAIFGSGAIVSPHEAKAIGQKTDLWLLTAASAGVVYGGIKLLKVGGVLGIGGGVLLILLDAPDNLKSENLENYFLLAYPEIDDREWLARLAAVARQHATLVPANHPDAISGSKIIEVHMPENEVEALLDEAVLTEETQARLRSDLL